MCIFKVRDKVFWFKGSKLHVLLFVFLIRQAKLEMDQYKEELSKMEKEIIHLKRDGESKSMQLSQLDMILDQTKTELEKKINSGKQLVS